MNAEKLQKLQANVANVRIGGKGTPRRKVKKAVNRQGAGDDRKLQTGLQKLNVQPIPGIEEVNMFKDDGKVIHFAHPRIQAAVNSNTYAIHGRSTEKELTELVPGILNQLGPESLAGLRKLAEAYQAAQTNQGEAAGDDDDEIPELVESFDKAEIEDKAE
ncbi:NAC domain-containing protein [Gongronella butleri]|nr:NAC domain-containing protein [Gongronella butleri]